MRTRHRSAFGPHNSLIEMWQAWLRDPKAMKALAEEEGFELNEAQLAEGTGAPEGRADFPIFLLSIIRRTMRQAFTRRASQWERYMGVERAEDFRQHIVAQLNGLSGMGPVPEFDSYPRIRSSEEAGPPYSVGKHGGIYGVTFEMVVNDDANLILNRTPTELGRMSAAYIAQVVAAMIEANPNYIDGLPFFTATARSGLPAGNEYTGAAAEPTEDNIVQQIEDMRNTTDSEGFPIEINPDIVLTRSERVRLNFKRITRSQETGTTVNDPAGTTADKGRLNVLNDETLAPDAVVVEPYLKDPNDYILLNEVGRAAFRIAFLRDQREPFIGIARAAVESVNGGAPDPYTLDFDELPYKVRSVFGTALGDPRAARRARRA